MLGAGPADQAALDQHVNRDRLEAMLHSAFDQGAAGDGARHRRLLPGAVGF